MEINHILNYTPVPYILIICGIATVVLSLLCFMFGAIYKGGKYAALKTIGSIMSVITLISGIILTLSFIGICLIIFPGQQAIISHHSEDINMLFYSICLAPTVFGMPVVINNHTIEISTLLPTLFYTLYLLIPAVLGIVAFVVSCKCRKAYRKAFATVKPAPSAVTPPPAVNNPEGLNTYTYTNQSNNPYIYAQTVQANANSAPVNTTAAPGAPVSAPASSANTAVTTPAVPISEASQPQFCSICQSPLNGKAFCPECGYPTGIPQPSDTAYPADNDSPAPADNDTADNVLGQADEKISEENMGEVQESTAEEAAENIADTAQTSAYENKEPTDDFAATQSGTADVSGELPAGAVENGTDTAGSFAAETAGEVPAVDTAVETPAVDTTEADKFNAEPASTDSAVTDNMAIPTTQPAYTAPEAPVQPQAATQPASTQYGYCTGCGAQLNGTPFCTNCGKPTGIAVVTTCPNCGAKLSPGGKFCPMCGTQV